jgi:tartrate dehydratase beta subunit/fumarate hydratase class I family protein
MRKITIPISAEVVRELKVGEPVALNGIMLTGRDAAHKWLIETFIKKTRQPQDDDLQVYA